MKKLFIAFIIFSISTPVFSNGGTDPKGRLKPMEIRKRQARPDIPGIFLIEFGWSGLSSAPNEIDIANIGSRTVNFYYMYDFPIANSKFSFRPGIGLGLDRYKFEDDVTLANDIDVAGEDIIVVSPLTGFDVSKTQLITNYIDIPLEFRFYTNPQDRKRSFRLGVGGKVGLRFSSLTKIKFEDDGENVKLKSKDSFGLNRFRYGVTGRVGFAGVNFFYYQSLSELFESGEGPAGTDNTTNFTVGISITGF